MDEDTFYDPDLVALVLMGFCHPGKGKSGDLPPRPECAPLWMDKVLAHLAAVRLTILIGQYAQRRFLPSGARVSVTACRAEVGGNNPPPRCGGASAALRRP